MRVLLLNQCFYPDVAATGQYLTELAVALSERGHDVTVIASRNGYDDPSLVFPRRETWRGIQIHRLATFALGKKGRARRALNFASFFFSGALRLLRLPRFDVVIALTSPPLISWLGATFVRLKGGRLVFWVMDLNPDEAIAAGWLKKDSAAARVLERFLRSSMRHSAKIVALDRFAKDRIQRKGVPEEKIAVLPPWSHDEAVSYDVEAREAFRKRHGLEGKFVVMYSGNHSPCHPLDTLLQAAAKLRGRTDIAFCFVGGGSEQHKVRAFAAEQNLENISCLPYQPLNELSASLSAGDLQVVVMGNAFPGILHPCKIYNILAIGTPFLYIGPNESHVADLLSRTGEPDYNYMAQHGDVDSVVKAITECADKPGISRNPQRSDLAGEFAKDVLLPRLVGIVEGLAGNIPESVAAASVPPAKRAQA
ncbi:MAG: colanic acid biosynthesis glycosyl transferase WcaI [Blastocatellia bacterium]|jgi:glycosyltransferase involved in cell wall biosynthesis|nr:colanic acid biosynthesis glycosyl transferase WcaI [Blastocatellia bacterium]